MRLNRCLLCAALFVGSTVRADEPAKDLVSFRKEIAPILLQSCQACHGAMRASGGFRVDTYERLLRESDSGRSIVPGKSETSDLLRLLTSAKKTERMPKKADPLSAAQIDIVRRWIDQGARFDGDDPRADLAVLVPPTVQPKPPKTYRVPVPVMALAFSPDGKELATGGYHEVLVWAPDDGRLLRRIENVGQRTQGLTYSPDGTLLAVGSGTPGESGELKTFDAKTGALVRSFGTSTDVVLGVAFSPDGKLLASAGADRTLRVYQTGDGKELCRVKQNADFVTGVAFNRAGTSVAGSSHDKMVKVFDPATGKLQATYVGHRARVFAVAFDPDSSRACTAGEDRRIHVWDPREVAAADGTAAQMEDRFKKALPVKHIAGFDKPVLGLAVQDGQVFSASADGVVRQHDLAALQIVREYKGLTDWANVVAVHAGSQRVAAGSFDGTVAVWNIKDGSLVVTFTAAPVSSR